MKFRTHFEDAIDIISGVVAAIIAFVITFAIQNHLDQVLLEERGKQAFGGEYFFYALVLAGISLVLFEIFSNVAHFIKSRQ